MPHSDPKKHDACVRSWKRRNKKKTLEINRRWWAKHGHEWRAKKFGMTPEQFVAMYDAQSGACAICGTSEKKLKTKLSIDHCHKTNRVRGLLCGDCNRAIGLMKDDPVRIRAASEYLLDKVYPTTEPYSSEE